METYFSSLFENVYCERSLILSLSLPDPDILRKRKLTFNEISIVKNLAPEQLHRQQNVKIILQWTCGKNIFQIIK